MKMTTRRLRRIIILAALIFAASDTAFLVDEAYGRAGRGGSYRSSGSGSSSRSSSSSSSSSRSSSTYHSTPSHRSSTSSSTSPGTRPYTPSHYTPPSPYDDNYIINSYSAVLKVNGNASVDVTETFNVTMSREMLGITRSISQQHQYNSLLITNVSSPQGNAAYSSNHFQIGYKGKKVKGRQTFVLNYRAIGAVLPHAAGAQLLWRSLVEKNPKIESIKIILPPDTAPVKSKAVIVPVETGTMHSETELKCIVAGNQITVPVNINVPSTVDTVVVLPRGVIDATAMQASVKSLFQYKGYSSLAGFTTRATLHEDRTIDREDLYEFSSDPAQLDMNMKYQKYFYTTYIRSGGNTNTAVKVHNTLYLYAFQKEPCGHSNFTSWSVCIPFDKKEKKLSCLKYSMWGNYNEKDPFFFDLRLPPAKIKRADRVRFEITFPKFVKKEQVQTRLYYFREAYYDRDLLFHETGFESRWEGSTLIGEYPGGIYDDQFLTARIFLPSEGFSTPGFFGRMKIYLSHNWYFSRGAFITIIVLIVLLSAGIAALALYIRKRKKAAGAVGTDTASAPRIMADRTTLEAIMAEDPGFSLDAFLERAKTIMEKIQEAWACGNMASVRNFVSQGVYNRFRLQLRLMREQEKVEDLMDSFTVHSANLVAGSLSHAYHTLHVNLEASARDITVPVDMPEQDKKRRLAKADLTRFAEIYSYTRKRGARTDASRNILSGQCPSCGSVPESFSDTNKCPNCATIYNSGEFDWVLAEITQAEEWKDSSSREVPGLAELEKENLSMNRSVIEDRASYLFWRWVHCRTTGSATPLARDATARFLETFKPGTEYFAETAVGSVDLLEVARVDGEARAGVLILWSASFSAGREPEHEERFLTLTLPVQMKNPYGFADHSCDTCGAPLPESDAEYCSYCGGALQKMNSDWLLDDIKEKV